MQWCVVVEWLSQQHVYEYAVRMKLGRGLYVLLTKPQYLCPTDTFPV